jgi:hypothetical protein
MHWKSAGLGAAIGASEIYSMTILHTEDALHRYKHMHKRLKPEVDLAIHYASPKKLDRDPTDLKDDRHLYRELADALTTNKDATVFTFSKGVLVDLALSAGVLTPDHDANRHFYPDLGHEPPFDLILRPQTPKPPVARDLYILLAELTGTGYTRVAPASSGIAKTVPGTTARGVVF